MLSFSKRRAARSGRSIGHRSVLLLLLLAGCDRTTSLPATMSAATAIKAEIRTGCEDDPRKLWFDLRLDPADLTVLAKSNLTQNEYSRFFTVHVEQSPSSGSAPPQLLGDYRVVAGMLRFQPRFPLIEGVRYRAEFEPAALAQLIDVGTGKYKRAESVVHFPKTPATPSTFVAKVYPSSNQLPENQLKFYLHFSAPMSRGEAYEHVHLFNAAGKEIELPFLDLHEELWDREGKRFTLFFDPGRIKRGLKPREEVGPALEEGRRYTLVVDASWPDSEGNPLKEALRKTFDVGPPDDNPPDPKTWKLAAPKAQTREPLAVQFPKPMDHAMLERVLQVARDSAAVPGRIEIGEHEMVWRFTPTQPWTTGGYQLAVATALEDLAGNSIGKPFEIDVFRPIQQKVEQETITLPFQVQ